MNYRLSFCALMALAACGGSSTSGSSIPITSDFRATDADGFIILDEPSGSESSQQSIRENFGEGVSYGITASNGGGVAAYSDLGAPTKDLVETFPAPLSGTATFLGSYNLLAVPDAASSLEIIDDGGAIMLDVNFGARTITGSADDIAFDMNIENTQDLIGTVTWRGIAGEVSGRAGEFSLLGAFHGHDDTGAYAGGIRAGR